MSETLSEYMAQKIYTNNKTKRMVIILGQAKNYKPPNNPGPKCRGEIVNINIKTKKIPNPGAKLKNLTTPCQTL